MVHLKYAHCSRYLEIISHNYWSWSILLMTSTMLLISVVNLSKISHLKQICIVTFFYWMYFFFVKNQLSVYRYVKYDSLSSIKDFITVLSNESYPFDSGTNHDIIANFLSYAKQTPQLHKLNKSFSKRIKVV